METLKENKHHYILREKEFTDTESLIIQIKNSKWVDNNTIFVNCFPEYSSIISQTINHRLSFINNHELFEMLNLAMPYSNMSQVWDPEEKRYFLYIGYLSDWVRKNINKSYKYLFIGSSVHNSNYTRLRSMLKGKLEPDSYRIAIPYVQKDLGYTLPDFFIEEYEGELMYQWQNMNNPNK